MPEIPDLVAIRDYCNAHIAGQVITRAEPRIPAVFRTLMQEFRETVAGDRLGTVLRHGKWLLFPLSSERVLAINAMLTGRFQHVEPAVKPRPKTCLILELESGRQLRYSDERLMGKLYLVPKDGLGQIPTWSEGGPDLLDPALTEDVWLERIRPYRGRIKGVITKSEFVQGIGNAYADEILWEARINPHVTRTSLSEVRLRELYRAAIRVTEWAIPLAAERMLTADGLDYSERRDFLHVHRRGGQPCPRCGATISELTSGQRITSFCRTCQPGFVRP